MTVTCQHQHFLHDIGEYQEDQKYQKVTSRNKVCTTNATSSQYMSNLKKNELYSNSSIGPALNWPRFTIYKPSAYNVRKFKNGPFLNFASRIHTLVVIGLT